jgi:uncharacterized Tic20 family protein
MTYNITSSDLSNYYELRSMLADLNRKIYAGGKPPPSSGTHVFDQKFDILFPKSANIETPYTTSDKIPTVAGKGETSTTYDAKIYSLKNLLLNSLYPHLNQTLKTTADPAKISNEHITTGATTKDHLCFIKFDLADAAATAIVPDIPVINNILYSICLIDIFIKIVEALKDCYKNYSNLFESFTDTTKIYIVEKKLKSYHDNSTPKGLFLDANIVSGSDKPLPAIYLYIGDLSNIFHPGDIKSVLSASSNFISASTNESITTHIFKDTNQLYTISTTTASNYFFNCLHLYTDEAQVTSSSTNAASAATAINKNYENNIYLIRIFLEMIKNIKGGTDFNTTINYLYIYLLCLKSILLSSIRAANIFYNNKHGLDAIAISYDDIFSTTVSLNGELNCSKLDIKGFVKEKSSITFSDAASCTATTKIIPYDTTTPKMYNYILYRKNSGTLDNDTIFKANDKRLYDEISNISKPNIDDSASSLGIEYYTLFKNEFAVNGDYIITSYDPSNHENSIDNGSFFKTSTGVNYESIKNMFILNKTNEFNKKYRIKIENDNRGYKVTNFSVYNSGSNSIKNVTITLEKKDKTDQNKILYDDVVLDKKKLGSVFIAKITSEDINSEYESIVTNTNSAEQNISLYKTKIKNNTTLYELHKSKNNLLFNQTMSYVVIIAIIISVLIIVNIAGVEKSLIKSVTLVCFGAIILLFMSYYITNTLYIEEGFSNSDYKGYELCPSSRCIITSGTEIGNLKKENSNTILQEKKDYVKNYLNDNAKNLIILINLIKPTIVNDSLKDNSTKLVTMSNNIYNEKKYVKDVLSNKKSDSDMNLDVLRYENKNYDVYIVCILFLSLILISAYTINIYTDNKYLDLLILIITILIVCLFTYFILYTNRIVRTVSTNYYWGKEYDTEYPI